MAHETHQDVNHPENKPNVSFNSSFWFVIILVGLFIAAINFVNMSGSEEKESNKANTEKASEAKEATAPAATEVKATDTVHTSQSANAPVEEKH